jgi:hypothetical protein
VAEGTIDIIPELESIAEAYLPLGVTILSKEPFGGALRLKIQGDAIEDGRAYQLVITDEPMRKCIELKPGGPDA